jgi:hypothetical protein
MLTWIIWAVRSSASCIMAITGGVIVLLSVLKYNPAMLLLGTLWVFGGVFAFPRLPGAWRRDKPSEKQIAYATKLGIDVTPEMTKGELSQMISSVSGR